MTTYHHGLGDVDCMHCEGIGYLRRDVPHEHPQFGKNITCPCHAPEVFRKASGIDEAAVWARDDSYYKRMPKNLDMEQTILHLLLKIERGDLSGWAVSVGHYGSGQTDWGMRVVMAAVRASIVGLYVSPSDMDDSFKEDFFIPPIVGRMKRVPVLVVDNIVDWAFKKSKGGESWEANQLLKMADARYKARFSTMTLWIVNEKWFTDKGDFMAALRSRMQDAVVSFSEQGSLRPALGKEAKAQRDRELQEAGIE